MDKMFQINDVSQKCGDVVQHEDVRVRLVAFLQEFLHLTARNVRAGLHPHHASFLTLGVREGGTRRERCESRKYQRTNLHCARLFLLHAACRNRLALLFHFLDPFARCRACVVVVHCIERASEVAPGGIRHVRERSVPR